MYILVESSKERYEDAIASTVVSVSENKELLSRYLEDEVREKISRSPDKYAEEGLARLDEIKNGLNTTWIQVDDEDYITVHFDAKGLIDLYTIGCPAEREYAGETSQILEAGNSAVIDDFRGAYSFLSNFHSCDIEYDGESYTSSECAFQAMKEADPAERGNYSHLYPSEAKKKGKSCNLRPDWEEVKVDVMYDILKVKFSDKDLRARLLLTDDKQLVEGNNWHDNFWGNCTCRKCEEIEGKNMLGKLLMKLRSDLKGDAKNN